MRWTELVSSVLRALVPEAGASQFVLGALVRTSAVAPVVLLRVLGFGSRSAGALRLVGPLVLSREPFVCQTEQERYDLIDLIIA